LGDALKTIKGQQPKGNLTTRSLNKQM